MKIACKVFGHKASPYRYGRLNQHYHAIDGIGRHHRIVEYRCERCGEWFDLCMLHVKEQKE